MYSLKYENFLKIFRRKIKNVKCFFNATNLKIVEIRILLIFVKK